MVTTPETIVAEPENNVDQGQDQNLTWTCKAYPTLVVVCTMHLQAWVLGGPEIGDMLGPVISHFTQRRDPILDSPCDGVVLPTAQHNDTRPDPDLRVE